MRNGKNVLGSDRIMFGLGSFFLMAIIAAGCGDGTIEARSGASVARMQEAVTDEADMDCLVVLRSVSRIPNGPGYETTCDLGIDSGGSCLYVWEGFVDLSSERAGAMGPVEVLVRTSLSQGEWFAVETKRMGESEGYVHYSFLIASHTPAAGMSMTSLNRTTIDLIPFVHGPEGQLVWDHNRIDDPLGTYHLNLDNMWSLDDAAVCLPEVVTAPAYVLSYPDFG